MEKNIEKIFVDSIERNARPRVFLDLVEAIKQDTDVCLLGAPGGLRTGLVEAATREVGALMGVLQCAKVKNEKDFLCELICSLKSPVKQFLEQSLSARNEETAAPNEDRAIEYFTRDRVNLVRKNVSEIDTLLHKINTTEKSHFPALFLEGVDLYQRTCDSLGKRMVLVIERLLEIRRWDNIFIRRDSLSEKAETNLRGYTYEQYLRSVIGQNPNISYVVLDVSTDVLLTPSKKRNYEACKGIFLPPLPSGMVQAWIQEFLEKDCGFHITEAHKCLKVIDLAMDGHTGHIKSLLCRLGLVCSGKKVVTEQDVKEAVKAIKKDFSPFAEMVFHTLSAKQIKLLEAISNEPSSSIYSRKYQQKYDLPPRSTLTVAIKSLQSKGLVIFLLIFS
jgi:hypothetical protein